MSLKSNVKQLIIYPFFGVITTAVNWAVYIGLQKVGVSVTASNAVAWFAAISVAFITNKKYTFKNKARSLKELLEQIILFVFSLAFLKRYASKTQSAKPTIIKVK